MYACGICGLLANVCICEHACVSGGEMVSVREVIKVASLSKDLCQRE